MNVPSLVVSTNSAVAVPLTKKTPSSRVMEATIFAFGKTIALSATSLATMIGRTVTGRSTILTAPALDPNGPLELTAEATSSAFMNALRMFGDMEAMRNSKAKVPAVVLVVMMLPFSSFTESTVGSSPVQLVESSLT